MDIRCVAVDLDGTALKNDKTLSPATIRAVDQAARAGLEVAFATGRTYLEFADFLPLLPAVRYAVCATGAIVLDCKTGQQLFCEPIAPALVAEAWRRVAEFDALFEVVVDSRFYVDIEKKRFWDTCMAATRNPAIPETRTWQPDFGRWVQNLTKPVPKIHMYFPTEAMRDAAWDALRDLALTICSTEDVDLEIQAQGVDKGRGLSQLAGHLGLAPSQVLAVGDSGNDVGMFQYAGGRAAMGNAAEELLALANLRLPDNEHDGVAWLLSHLASGEALPWS